VVSSGGASVAYGFGFDGGGHLTLLSMAHNRFNQSLQPPLALLKSKFMVDSLLLIEAKLALGSGGCAPSR
jgi:hypothetical protein